MPDLAVRATEVGKLYRLGGGPQYGRLTESLMQHLRFSRASRRRRDEVWALRDVSFDVRAGTVVGLIGRNGAGKSTLLKILSRITDPTEGEVAIRGRVGALLEVGTGFHPELSGRENVFLNGAILGMKRVEIARKFDAIVDFAGVDRFLDTPVKRYSSGMHVRLAFAVAAFLEPEILLVDEVLAVGDVAFQRRCLGRMGEITREGRTVLFVSHNMAAIRNLCTSAHLIDRGTILSSGPTDQVIATYLETVSERGAVALAERQDRRGDGQLVLTDFRVFGGTDDGYTGICGERGGFRIDYKAVRMPSHVNVSVGVFTLQGEPALHVSNEVSGNHFESAPAEGSLFCEFPKLPLLPGSYYVNIHCSVNGVVADWVTEAAQFHVSEGDFYRTGRLPPPGYGAVAVDYEWAIGGARSNLRSLPPEWTN